MLKGAKLTDVVVGGTLGLAILAGVFYLLGPEAGTIATLYLAYEAFTLVNKERADTISESFVRFSRRPLVPLLMGLAIGTGITIVAFWLSLPLKVLFVIFFVGLLSGHFFWQFQGHYEPAENA